MNKILHYAIVLIFILFTTITVFPEENQSKNTSYSWSGKYSINPSHDQFSLKMNHKTCIKKINIHSFLLETSGERLRMQQAGQNPRIDEIKKEIKKIKKKRIGSLIGTSAFAALGGFFMYEFFTYGEQLAPARDPISHQYVRPGVSRKRNYLFGALTSFGIGATFLNSTLKAKKRIRAYEKELKRLKEVQQKLNSHNS